MRKLRIRKIKKLAQGHDKKVTICKQIITEHLLWLWRHNGKQDKVSTWIFVEKGDMNKHLRFQSPLCHAAYWGQKSISNHEASLSLWNSGHRGWKQSPSHYPVDSTKYTVVRHWFKFYQFHLWNWVWPWVSYCISLSLSFLIFKM